MNFSGVAHESFKSRHGLVRTRQLTADGQAVLVSASGRCRSVAEVEQSIPSVDGPSLGRHPETRKVIFEEVGPRSVYLQLANKHYAAIEKELGNETQGRLF